LGDSDDGSSSDESDSGGKDGKDEEKSNVYVPPKLAAVHYGKYMLASSLQSLVGY